MLPGCSFRLVKRRRACSNQQSRRPMAIGHLGTKQSAFHCLGLIESSGNERGIDVFTMTDSASNIRTVPQITANAQTSPTRRHAKARRDAEKQSAFGCIRSSYDRLDDFYLSHFSPRHLRCIAHLRCGDSRRVYVTDCSFRALKGFKINKI